MFSNKYEELKQNYRELVKEHKVTVEKLRGYKTEVSYYRRMEEEYRDWIRQAKEAKLNYDEEIKQLHLLRAKYQKEMKEFKETIKKLKIERENDDVEA